MDFLRDLWRLKPEDGWILLWSLSTGRSEFYTNVEAAIEAARRLNRQGDVYVGTGLRAQSLPADKRGGTADVTAIAALWLDIDVVSEAHQKINLFADKEEAEQFVLETTPLPPSYTIDTGHGLQCWWLFDELWVFANEAERRSAMDLSRRWTNTFRFRAHERGLDIDATHDLSRVLRIPDTHNHKDVARGGPPLMVTVREQRYRGVEIARYSVSDFEPYLLDSPETSRDEEVDVGDFVINLSAEPPIAKFDLLEETSVKFRRSWKHDRSDLTDQSLSSYDMSLGALASHAGWSVQEIVNLIIAHRRRYGESGSHKNMEDYLRRTLRKCMAHPFDGEGPPMVINSPTVSPMTTASTDASAYGAMMRSIAEEESPAHKLSTLSSFLQGITITSITKYKSDPPTYIMDTNHGKIHFDKVESLTAQPSFRNHIFAAVGKMLPQVKRQQWDDILNILGDAMQEQEVANDATDEGIITSYLIHYLGDRPPTDSNADAFRTQSAFAKAEHVYIFGSALRMWIYATYRHTIVAREFGILMRKIGAHQSVLAFDTPQGKRTTRHCWVVPPKVIAAMLGE